MFSIVCMRYFSGSTVVCISHQRRLDLSHVLSMLFVIASVAVQVTGADLNEMVQYFVLDIICLALVSCRGYLPFLYDFKIVMKF